MAHGCAALALCDGASAARLPLFVLMGAALARLGRQQEAVAACDAGLRLPRPLATGGGGGGGGGAAAGGLSSLEHERLLLRCARLVLTSSP